MSFACQHLIDWVRSPLFHGKPVAWSAVSQAMEELNDPEIRSQLIRASDEEKEASVARRLPVLRQKIKDFTLDDQLPRSIRGDMAEVALTLQDCYEQIKGAFTYDPYALDLLVAAIEKVQKNLKA
jgi:hypothetical protein